MVPEDWNLPRHVPYTLDMHGFFDLAKACYRDALDDDPQVGRLLSELEFLLGSSYALWRALLDMKSCARGLSAEEADAHVYLRSALPDPYPVTGKLGEYLRHLGVFTTGSGSDGGQLFMDGGAEMFPDFVLPRCSGAGIAGTPEPVGSWSCMHQPLFHSLALTRLSGNYVGLPGALVVAPAAMDSFTKPEGASLIPGAFPYFRATETRLEAIAGRYRPIIGPSEQARFQLLPELQLSRRLCWVFEGPEVGTAY